MVMEKIIKEKLKTIVKDSGIKILYSCESGSRGWQFPSPDSDYDVRFIYSQPFNNYLSVEELSTDLKFPIGEELDIYGWDIKKVLQLVRKSNTTPFEWLQSPIIYQEVPHFRVELWDLCQQYFSQRSNILHYLGIAKGAQETMEGDKIKIKKLFYVLRPLLSAKWCLEKNSIAPMTIIPLLELVPSKIKTIIQALIDLKATAAEGFVITVDDIVLEYINKETAHCYDAVNDLKSDRFDAEPLNRFFRKTIADDYPGIKG
jgi:uncharacterized protein